MEKQAAPPKPNSSSKKVMANFLPKVLITSAVAFDHHNHHHHHHHHHESSDNKVRVVYPATSAGRRAFSGPLVSMIPPEARRETKNGTTFLDSQEPTSPKISCMGQLVMKPRKNKMEKKGRSSSKLPANNNHSNKILTARLSTRPTTFEKNKNEEVAASNKRSSSMKLSAMIRRMLPNERKSSAAGRLAAEEIEIETVPTRSRGRDPPALCHMKRFSSGRDALATFDWWSATNKLCDRSRNHYSYDDEDVLEGCSDDGGEYEHYDDPEDYKIPFSAPIGGEVMELEQQRKEINLWKRRTMAPPRPLELMKI